MVLQELIEAEAAEVIGAPATNARPTRTTQRNGHRDRQLSTQAGDVSLRIPKLRQGAFFPVILEPRRRIDQALHAVVMEAYVHGVSTRSVDDLVAGPGHRRRDLQVRGVADLRRPRRGGRRVPDPHARAHQRSPTSTSTRPTCTCARPASGRWCPRPSSWPPGSPPAGGREVLGLAVGRQRGGDVLAGVSDRPTRPRPVRGPAGDLRPARRPGRRAAPLLPRRGASALPGALRPQPARADPQVAQGHGRRAVPHHLRSARPRPRSRRRGRRSATSWSRPSRRSAR